VFAFTTCHALESLPLISRPPQVTDFRRELVGSGQDLPKSYSSKEY
jgi:hypothetical protein